MKSKILFWISLIDGRFRDLVLLASFFGIVINVKCRNQCQNIIEILFVQVKEWAKAHHINDSKSGTLNSYCLSMLVLYHLQVTFVPQLSFVWINESSRVFWDDKYKNN